MNELCNKCKRSTVANEGRICIPNLEAVCNGEFFESKNMTNAEKFKAVFGVELYSGFCPHIETEVCIEHDCCADCPYENWTEQEYKKDSTNG